MKDFYKGLGIVALAISLIVVVVMAMIAANRENDKRLLLERKSTIRRIEGLKLLSGRRLTVECDDPHLKRWAELLGTAHGASFKGKADGVSVSVLVAQGRNIGCVFVGVDRLRAVDCATFSNTDLARRKDDLESIRYDFAKWVQKNYGRKEYK